VPLLNYAVVWPRRCFVHHPGTNHYAPGTNHYDPGTNNYVIPAKAGIQLF
jgi:hypothetical protein